MPIILRDDRDAICGFVMRREMPFCQRGHEFLQDDVRVQFEKNRALDGATGSRTRAWPRSSFRSPFGSAPIRPKTLIGAWPAAIGAWPAAKSITTPPELFLTTLPKLIRSRTYEWARRPKDRR